jgi:HAD superfamily hydrolase (TIGR01509 family)
MRDSSDYYWPGMIVSIRAVILDMDGLMLDTEHVYKRAWQQAASQLGFVLDDGFYFTLIGRTNAAAEIGMLERFGLDFPLPLFRERWSGLWRGEVEACGIPLKPGLMELLQYLAARNIPAGIATSSDREYAAVSLRAAGLDARRFAHIVTGEQVEKGKPAPDIYLEAARRLGVDPARSLVLEDSDAGIVSASEAGMIAVIVPDLKPPSPEARARAFRVLHSLHEAISLIDDLSDLP